MNLIIENKIKFDHLIFLGDTHGRNMQIAPQLLSKFGLDNKDETKAIVHVGDFGIGFKTVMGDKLEMDYLNERLKKYDVTLYIVRGNHDDPIWFNSDFHDVNELLEDWSNIVFVPDHTLLTLEVKGKEEPIKIYCNGGAVSVDRIRRTTGRSYWTNEKFNLPTQEQLDEIPDDLDIIVTHTRPLGVMPVGIDNIQGWILEDGQLEEDLKREAQDMWVMFDAIREKNKLSGKEINHFYGHFHMHLSSRTNHIKHTGLNINELYHYRI